MFSTGCFGDAATTTSGLTSHWITGNLCRKPSVQPLTNTGVCTVGLTGFLVFLPDMMAPKVWHTTMFSVRFRLA